MTEFLSLLNYLNFKQHITQPTHNRGHTWDLVITYGLSTGVSSVVDLAVSDHYYVFFNISSFIQQEAPLPAPCDFIVDNFNSKLRSALDSLSTKTISIKPTPPWIKTEIKQLKRNCRSAERRWRQTKLTVHYDIFRDSKPTIKQ